MLRWFVLRWLVLRWFVLRWFMLGCSQSTTCSARKKRNEIFRRTLLDAVTMKCKRQTLHQMQRLHKRKPSIELLDFLSHTRNFIQKFHHDQTKRINEKVVSFLNLAPVSQNISGSLPLLRAVQKINKTKNCWKMQRILPEPTKEPE